VVFFGFDPGKLEKNRLSGAERKAERLQGISLFAWRLSNTRVYHIHIAFAMRR